MKLFIEAERLILREIVPTDNPGLFEINSDPERWKVQRIELEEMYRKKPF